MAERAPRSVANMVFVVLLALALAGGVWATLEMFHDALTPSL